jgi:hypothetical protein
MRPLNPLYNLSGVSRQEELKNTNIFARSLFPNKSTILFLFFRCFRAFFSDGSSKTLQKTIYKKNRAEKFLQKKRQKSKNRISSILLSRFLAFLGEGSSKTPYKISKNKIWP